MTSATAPTTHSPAPAESIPDRITVHLTHRDLEPVLAPISEPLRAGFSYYGEVTADQYRELTGDADYSRLKLHMAIETESPEGGFGIIVHVCDILTEEQGYCAMQTQLIRHLVDHDARGTHPEYWERCRPHGQEPRTDQEWQAIAKPLDDLSYPALQFLLQLADIYEPDPFQLSPVNFDEALRNYPHNLQLADFVRPETLDL